VAKSAERLAAEPRDVVERRLGHPVDASVRGVRQPIPGLATAAVLCVVVLAGVVAPLLAWSGLAFVLLAGVAGAIVGVLLLLVVPRLSGRHLPVVVVVDGPVVRVFERTPTDRLGEQLLSGPRSGMDHEVPPIWQALLLGCRGGYVTVDGTRIGLTGHLELGADAEPSGS